MLVRDLHPSSGASSPGSSGNKFGAILPPSVPGCKPRVIYYARYSSMFPVPIKRPALTPADPLRLWASFSLLFR